MRDTASEEAGSSTNQIHPMPWNPEVYNQFKSKRQEPFHDMITLLHARPGMSILDLGCGTGELTEILASRFPASRVMGVDTSAEMLSRAPRSERLSFVRRSVEEQLAREEKWDIVVANASLQWINDHRRLFREIIRTILPEGQLAVQMPAQKENLLNQLLEELVQEQPYFARLKKVVRHSPVLTLDDYTQLLYELGAKETVIFKKVYPIIATSVDSFYEFIAGSALIPYMEAMEELMRHSFKKDFKSRIAAKFSTSPMVYSFKRIILVARF